MPKLHEEIGKKQPFERPEQEAFLNLVRTASQLQTAFHRLFKPYGLSSAGYNVLRILRGNGEDGRCGHEIARDVVATRDAFRPALQRLW